MARCQVWIAFCFFCVSSPLFSKPNGLIENKEGREICFLLYDLKNKKEIIRDGGSICSIRLPPCSSFKVPLAIIAFEERILIDEHSEIKWDQKINNRMPSWNKDQTAMSWMRESVLWFSQKLTLQLGRNKVESYLKDFDYGNHDLSGGLYKSWLGYLSEGKNLASQSTLKISAVEQLEFIKKLFSNQLDISERTLNTIKNILVIEPHFLSFSLSGKTGSGWSINSKKQKAKLGWFIGSIKNNYSEFVFTTLLLDSSLSMHTYTYAGPHTKDLTKKILAKHFSTEQN